MMLTISEGHAATADPRSTVRHLLLDNGLQLVWEEDHRQPLVAIEVRIKGGLRGEGPYLGTGITHFIEHMLFKGTTTRAPGMIEQEVRRYGGTINAFTSFDMTGISLFVEATHLKDALGMVADIMQHAVFPPAEFEKERAVVISEIQMNKDDPDRRLQQLFWSRHFLEHPYRHPILGYQPLLERLTVEDMARFYAAQYQPQHITVSCVGDLDPAALPGIVQEVFGGWARGTGDHDQRVIPQEPPTASAKEAAEELPVQTEYVVMGFTSTRLSDPDLYPLDVLAGIIGHGRSSRLYETVVRKRKLAHAITAWNYTPADPGIFAIQFRTDPEKVLAAKREVLEILEEIKARGVTDAELAKAKRQASAEHLFGLQTIEARASDLASSFAGTGDPLFSSRYVEGIASVTAEQVRNAARRYCDAAKMTTAIVRPPREKPSAQAEALSPVAVEKTVMDNGATRLIGMDRTLPIAAIAVVFRGGVRVEEEASQGLCNLTAQLLTKGTTRRSALEIAEQVESLGGTLEPFSGRDSFGLVLQLLAQDLDAGLALMHELVTQSAFPENELETQRELIVKQLQAEEDEIFDVGGRLLRRELFGSHPYRFHPLGDRQTVPSLTRENCRQFARRWVSPSNMVVAVFGDVEAKQVGARVQKLFGAIPADAVDWPARLPSGSLEGIREATKSLEKEQALVMLGFRGSTHAAEDRFALDVVTAVLSGMAGRLFQSVRERHGLSYTLGAVHAPGWDPGYLLVYAATRPEERERVVKVLEQELALAADKGFTAEEISQAQRYLIGLHRIDLQHLVGLAKRSAIDEIFGLGYDDWKRYEAHINAVTPEIAHAAATRYLTLQRRAQVVISPNGNGHPVSPR